MYPYLSQCLTRPYPDQLAARLNAKLNYVPGEGGEPLLRPVEEGGIFQKYEEELEINDFPQQARWKVTSKEALAQISEYSEAGITVRGQYWELLAKPPLHATCLFQNYIRQSLNYLFFYRDILRAW